jgi:hypothetical protein
MALELVPLNNAEVYVRFRLTVKVNFVKISPLMSIYFTAGLDGPPRPTSTARLAASLIW